MNEAFGPAIAGASLLQDYLAACELLASAAELNRLTLEAILALGFDYFAVVHHTRYGVPNPDYVGLHCYPEAWVGEIRDMGRPPDPVQRAAERVASGFRWEKMDAIIAVTPREKAHLARAARHDIGTGYTVANHVPGEAPGSSSFACRIGRDLPERHLPAAQALGSFAFEAARRLRRRGQSRWLEPVALSDRQRDCVLLAAQGKSDTTIAQLLGLKPRTINEHIEAAKRRYGVATRAQLVVQALLRGEIWFGELIRPTR